MSKDNGVNVRLGLKISSMRKKMNMTQEDLSEYSDLSQNFISQIETGKKSASVVTLHKVAQAMGLPMSRFFDDPETTIFKDDSIIDKSIILMVKKLTYPEKKLLVNMLKGMISSDKKKNN